ncbi:MAG: peptidase M23 [Flavobacteriaceae bacterium TMED212]|nr:MAG: peptidase M23 [Flavobacteriaceae bacterium TMED212]|tara:strand:- start:2532 stop:3509 length:978 start_codon:yes stop_codon:yes gene_type:complete
MAKLKYFYDKESLSFRPVKTTWYSGISGVVLFLLSTIFFGVLALFVLLNTDTLNTPNELLQAREIENFKFQYELLNKKLENIEEVMANVADRDNNLYRVYFEASPIPEEQRKMGFGGVNRYDELEGYENSKLIINTTKRLEVLTKQVVVQSRSLEELESIAKNKEDLLSAMPSIQPIHKNDLKRIASGFGYRRDPFTKKRRFHQGMDFTAPRGTPVYASGNGVVGRADNRASGYGKHVRIDHGFGYVSLYAHLNKYNVKRRQKVKRGDIIGYVGSTGRSVGPHLHYEIFKDGKRVNPLNYYSGNLTAEEFDIMLNLASQENQSMD